MGDTSIRAIKGFDRNLSCRGYQFAVGQTYEHDGPVKACSSGFHACTDPRDVFGYYAPGTSRFCEVELSGEVATHGDDSKVAARRIRIVRELSQSQVVGWCVAYAAEHNTPEGEEATGHSGSASATGCSGSASATGCRGSASATGYRGSASATGDSGSASATGKHAVALAAGWMSSASAADGCALFLVERDDSDAILSVWAGIAGRDGIKAGVAYALTDGKPVEAP